MQTFITFVNVIIVVSSVLSCVCSLPTQQFENELVEVSPISVKSATCFESDPYPYNREIKDIKEYAVDSEGRPCLGSFTDQDFPSMLDITQIDSKYANLTGEFCPNWPENTKCLRDHLNSNKCNEDDRKQAMEAEFLNTDIAIAELLCSPTRTEYFLNLVKNMLNVGLWDCITGESIQELTEECTAKKFEERGQDSPFQYLSRYFDCLTLGLRSCANGDSVKEALLVQLWKEFDQELQEAHRGFWK